MSTEDDIAHKFEKWIDPKDWKIDPDTKSEWSRASTREVDDEAPKVHKKGGFNRSTYKKKDDYDYDYDE